MQGKPLSKSDHARMTLIVGCMFSGKTTELIERLEAAQHAGRRVVSLKHAVDTRYDADALATHDRRRFPARRIATPAEIPAAAAEADVVGIDEVHFYDGGLVSAVAALRTSSQAVILVGLEHDVWGDPFPVVAKLKAAADEVVVTTTPCSVCGAPARYSQRMVPLVDGQWVGGPEAYEPRCAAHFEPFWQPKAEVGG